MMSEANEASRLAGKSSLHAVQAELQQEYGLSAVEARALAQRVRQLVAEQGADARQEGQIRYAAIALAEPAGKPLAHCRKVKVQLTLLDPEDAQVWSTAGCETLRRLRVHRLVHEALLQGGALSQEDLACVLGISLKSVKRIFAYYRGQGQRLPSRGELGDIGPGVSHKVAIIRKYVQDIALARISRALGDHGLESMARYLRHFALVMVLRDRGLGAAQMQSIIGISENLIGQYQALYDELNTSAHEQVLERLKRSVFASEPSASVTASPLPADEPQKGGR